MKNLVFTFFTLVALSFSLGACKHSHDHDGHKHDHEDGTEHVHEDVDKTGKEYISKYICPMHCEGSGAEEAGTCPVCGMDYVLNEDHSADGHDHDNDNDHGHDHDHDGHEH